MLSIKRMEEIIGTLLLTGTLIATLLVLSGGIMYLMQSGTSQMDFNLLRQDATPISLKQIWSVAFSFSSLGFIELGLLVLVMTQILRVTLLVGLFALIKDYKFTLISFFILCVLIYSFIFH